VRISRTPSDTWDIAREVRLVAGEIHVWRAGDAQPSEILHRLTQTLSDDEKSRAVAYHFEADSRRYIACRGILRDLLGRYLNRSPESLRFGYTAFGKPFLTDDPSLAFNVSHTKGLCLLAFSAVGDVGVDVEVISDQIDIKSLADKYFHPHEWEALVALPEGDRRAAFFACWTCKEAYLKARGLGLSENLSTFEVIPPLPTVGEAMIHPRSAEAYSWWLGVLAAGASFAAAVSSAVRPTSLRCFDWQI